MQAPAENRRLRVAVAGATGFVGQRLLAALVDSCDVVALARSPRAGSPGVEWRALDLFNLRETETGLEGCHVACYLVHSMMPSARLTQGTFADMDLLCADNFARAARSAGVEHIVYLGGLAPEAGVRLSRHLESRLEVERTLGSHGVPVVALRAGLVIGKGGSSFEMMVRLVKRLPFMVAPRWTQSLSQSIDIRDAVALLRYAIDHPSLALAGRAYDVGCPDVMSYAEMLQLTSTLLGKKTHIVPIPVDTVRLSLLWVSVFTGAPQALVRPLVESLEHDLIARDGLVLQREAGIRARPLREALADAIAAPGAKVTPRASSTPLRATASKVRSVQRLPLPVGKDARWVAEEYARWLPRFLRPLLRVDANEQRDCRLFLGFWAHALLVLVFAHERSSPDRQLFYVTGGLLAGRSSGPRPRLEFRSVPGGTFVLAAVHDFVPRLPWFIYTWTQALAHLWVMTAFGRHLGSHGALAGTGTLLAGPPHSD